MFSLGDISLDANSSVPVYRQLADAVCAAVRSGTVKPGDRLPATRELAGQLGLNRATVSAAYAVLEQTGLLQGQVGRGSFIAVRERLNPASPMDWEALLPPLEATAASARPAAINFASSRPAQDLFPMAEFRRLSRETVDDEAAAEILQLGSPLGYAPLRKYLLSAGLPEGSARSTDNLIVTNGCQQALDLLARVLVTSGSGVLLEDPVYHGMHRVFSRSGARILPVPVGESGIELNALESIATQNPAKVLVVTPDFQNPTGVSLPLEARKALLALTKRLGLIVVESSVYRELRYTGDEVPSLKQLDGSGNVISIGSYSKVAFPGLRVGWILAPHPVIDRLAEAKQTSDLHSDQLSQAVLLRFAESGELARHLKGTKQAGAARLRTALQSCHRYLPEGSRFTRPDGGMNLWVELPAPLAAEDLLKKAAERGVSFLPGSNFSARRGHWRALRISFGGLSPELVKRGIEILGDLAREQLAAHRQRERLEPVAALV